MRWVLLVLFLATGIVGCAHPATPADMQPGHRITIVSSVGTYSGDYGGETEDAITLVRSNDERLDVPKRDIVSIEQGDQAQRTRKKHIAGGILAGVGVALGATGAATIASAHEGGFVDISGPQRVLGGVLVGLSVAGIISGIVLLAQGD